MSSLHTSDLAYLSAVEALALFRTRELSPVQLLEALIERAEEVDPTINAFSDKMYEEARLAAQQAEDRYLGKGGLRPRPLEGIPVAIKEKHAIAGKPLTEGSLAFRDVVATENAPIVDRILDAGAVIHARTTTPEFCVASFTHSRLWGVTRNPWNLEFTPGGSSGGSGAALAAGTTMLASASDIGGSTRIPAAFTGTVGYKPSYGRIPGKGPLSADTYRSDGPMARTVDDCLTFANVLMGPDPRDHTVVRPGLTLSPDQEPVDGMRIALCVGLGDYPVDAEVDANTRAAAAALADAGAVVEEIELPWTMAEIYRTAGIHYANIFGATVLEISREHRDQLTTYAQAFADFTERRLREVTFLDALRGETRLQYQLSTAMTGFDALLCPTIGVPGFPAGDDLLEPVLIGDMQLESLDEMCMTIPFNIANRCPVLAVPSGHSSSGMPTGVQIVGHTYDDATVFRVGKALEHLRPWVYSPDHRPELRLPAAP